MSQRKIAEVLGVSHETVRRDTGVTKMTNNADIPDESVGLSETDGTFVSPDSDTPYEVDRETCERLNRSEQAMPDYRRQGTQQVSNPPSRTAPAQKRSAENQRGMLIALVLIFIGASIQSLANYGAGSGSTVGGIGAFVALTSVYPLRFLRWWLLLVMPLVWVLTAVLSVVLPFGLWVKQAGMI